MSLSSLLLQMGLGEKESLVYTSLSRHPSLTISELSRDSGVKRTTLYSIVESMKQNDLIIEDTSSAILTYRASSTEVLKKKIQIEKFELQRKEAALEKLEGELQKTMLGNESSQRKIVTIPHRHLLSYLYERSEIWNKSIVERGAEFIGFQDQLFAKKYAKWIDWYWKLPSSRSINLRMLSNQSVFEDTTMRKRRYNQRTIRYWKESSEIAASTWIAGEYVIITNLRDKPYSLIEIRDATIAESYRQIFEGMWRQII